MHKSHVSVFAAFALAVSLSGCDESKLSPLAPSDAVGAVSFRLSTADSSALSGTVDSVLLRAISRSDTESVRGSLGSALVLSGLPEGPCSLEAFLYGKDGTLQWSGHDTVRVRAGEETPATLVLHKATGSVRVTVVLDSTRSGDSSFTLYTMTVHPDYPIEFTYALNAKGTLSLVRYFFGQRTSDTTIAQLSSADLARMRTLLESPAARHPDTLPELAEIDTVVKNGDTTYVKSFLCGGPYYERSIAYANGNIASSAYNSNTQQESSGWIALSPVDRLFESLLPMRVPQQAN
jgi:hypothetical protein